MVEEYKVYNYRWVVLGVFMLLNLTMQVLWISYAPITGPATTITAFLICKLVCFPWSL